MLVQALSNQLILTHEETVHRRRLLLSAAGWAGEEGLVDLDASAAGLTPRNSLNMQQQQASPDKPARGSKLDRGSAKQAGKKDSAKKEDKGGKKEDKSRRSEHHHSTHGSEIFAYHIFLLTYCTHAYVQVSLLISTNSALVLLHVYIGSILCVCACVHACVRVCALVCACDALPSPPLLLCFMLSRQC